MGYLLSRTLYHEKHKLPVPASGEVVPSFDEEVTARADAVQIYRELRAQGKTRPDPYWDDVAKVDAKKFMRAYVWIYLRRPSWRENQKPKDLAAFQRWRASVLKNHRVETHGRLVATRK